MKNKRRAYPHIRQMKKNRQDKLRSRMALFTPAPGIFKKGETRRRNTPEFRKFLETSEFPTKSTNETGVYTGKIETPLQPQERDYGPSWSSQFRHDRYQERKDVITSVHRYSGHDEKEPDDINEAYFGDEIPVFEGSLPENPTIKQMAGYLKWHCQQAEEKFGEHDKGEYCYDRCPILDDCLGTYPGSMEFDDKHEIISAFNALRKHYGI